MSYLTMLKQQSSRIKSLRAQVLLPQSRKRGGGPTASGQQKARWQVAGGYSPVKAGACVLGKAGGHVSKSLRQLLSASERRGRWLAKNGGRCSLNAFRRKRRPPPR